MKFKSDIEIQAGIKDKDGQIGGSGQILASTGSQVDWIDQSDIISASSKLVVIACKNTSGATITKGTPVYQTGTVGATDVIEIAKADASDENKMAAIGLLQTDLINNEFGNVVITGELLNLITSPIDGATPTTGDTIYVKPGGGLTLTKPTGVNFIQNVGLIGKVSTGNSGSITVSSIMRSNDVPTPLYIDHTNQRLGIGTSSPQRELHVHATNYTDIQLTNDTTGAGASDGSTISATGNDLYINNKESGNLLFYTNNSEKARVTSSGNVGIGTTSPSSKLHIEDSISDGSLFKITTSTSGSLQPVFDARIASNGDTYYDFNAYKSATKKIQIKSANTSYIQQVDGTGGFDIKGHLKTSLQTVNGGGVLQLHRFGALSLNDDASYAHQPASALYINTLYNTSTDYLMLLANQGSDKLAVDLNGNVGIGTSSPSQKLEVSGAVLAGDYRGSAQIYLTSPDSWIFRSTGGNERMRVTSAGNVGIGTTSPGKKLEVNGTFKATGDASIDGTGNLTIRNQSATGSGVVFIDNVWQGGIEHISGNLYFRAGGQVDRMTIKTGGNVGIGTTSPGESLEISKSANHGIKLSRPSSGSNPGSVLMQVHSSGKFMLTADNDAAFTTGTSTDSFVIKANSGNVGIGTSSPSYILDVVSAGTATARLKSAGTGAISLRYENGGGFKSAAVVDNNGLYRLDATNISLNPTSNVGIGTTSPSEKLEVVGNVKLDGDNRHIYFGGNNTFIGERSNSTELELRGGGNSTAQTVYIDNLGGMGIGTNNPGEKLDVRGNIHLEEAFPSIIFKRNTSGLQEYSIKNEGNFTIEKTTLDSGGSFIIKDENGKTPLDVSMGLLNPDIAISGDLFVKNKTGTTTNLYVQENNGNVGIGTTSPSEKLGVFGNIRLENGAQRNIIGPTNENLGIFANPNGSDEGILFSTDNGVTTEMIILNGGNVGIGTTSPSAKLDIHYFTSGGNDDLLNIGLDAANPTRAKIYTENYDGNFGLWDSGSNQKVKVSSDGNSYLNGGNLGIGTTSPSQKLEVAGNISLSGNILASAGDVSAVNLNLSSATGPIITLTDTDASIGVDSIIGHIAFVGTEIGGETSRIASVSETAGGEAGLRFYTGSSVTQALQLDKDQNATFARTVDAKGFRTTSGSTDYSLLTRNSTNTAVYIQQAGTGNIVDFRYGSQAAGQGTSAMVIDDSGKVGIGTTSPSERLEVDGNIKSKRITLSHSGYAGYINQAGDFGGGPLYIRNMGQNHDINFQGNKGGATSTSLHIDGLTHNIGIGTTSPSYKLDVDGGTRAGGVVTYSKYAGSLTTTGYAVAGLTSSSNGSSAGFTFTCFGHAGCYQKIVYSCYNDLGTWKTKKVIDEGTNDFDVATSADGSTITFTFKSTSGTKNYTPRVIVEATGSAINSSYA